MISFIQIQKYIKVNLTELLLLNYTYCLTFTTNTFIKRKILKSHGVIIGDTVAVANPVLTNHSVALEDKQWSFRSIRVENPAELVVNKKKWSESHCAYTTANMTATDSAAQK